jgi:hypothetical protein
LAIVARGAKLTVQRNRRLAVGVYSGMEDMLVVDDERELVAVLAEPEVAPARTRLRSGLWRLVRKLALGIASLIEWLFGLLSLLLGLSILAALPIINMLTLGYFLESSARVARSGRIRDGFVGVRKAALVGGVTAGIWLSLVPSWLVGIYARSAEVINPGGRSAILWRIGLIAVTAMAAGHIGVSCLRGGRLRHFLWPFGGPFWLARRLRQRGLYSEARDGLWAFAVSLRVPYYFWLGLVGFVGTLAWLAIPGALIAAVGVAPLLAPIGMLLLAIVVPFLPFLQVRYALEGHLSALFSRRAIRDRFRCAPWAFAFSLFVLLLASIPLYLLKIEKIPPETAWLPSLVFVIFLAPARLLTGWAYARSGRRTLPRKCDLQLTFDATGLGDIPTEGKSLLILAIVDGALYFRVFDRHGKVDEDTDDSKLTDQARKLEDLRRQLESLRPPHELSKREKRRAFSAAASIVGYSLPRHWIFRVLGRMAIVVAAMFYVLVVFLAQYTSWGGASSLYQQHAFLLPAPFFGM